MNGLRVGFNWDSEEDLDGALLFSDSEYSVKDREFWYATASVEGIFYNGDTDEDGYGDNESIEIELELVDPWVRSIWVVVSISEGGNYFSEISATAAKVYISD